MGLGDYWNFANYLLTIKAKLFACADVTVQTAWTRAKREKKVSLTTGPGIRVKREKLTDDTVSM